MSDRKLSSMQKRVLRKLADMLASTHLSGASEHAAARALERRGLVVSSFPRGCLVWRLTEEGRAKAKETADD